MKKIGFVTCVQLGFSCIKEIYRLGGTLDLLITLQDEKARNKSGRIYLDNFAAQYNIPLVKVNNINEEVAREVISEKKLDWLFIIGWSQIARKEILHTPKEGCIGIHPTLLPVGRGRASIPWAILKGLPETGVTMFRLNEGVDTGEIIGQERIRLNETTTATELYQKVNDAHIVLIQKNWKSIIEGRVVLLPQDESEATVWPERGPEDGRITKDMTVQEALTLVRAVTHPYPGAFLDTDGRRFRIWCAKREGGTIESSSSEQNIIRLRDGYIRLLSYEMESRI